MENLSLFLLLICAFVLVSIFVSKASARYGVPALLLFLAVGMLAGSEGVGGIYFDDAAVARSVGVLALALILFSSGLDTRFASIRPVLTRGIVLSTVGTLTDGGLVGLFASLVMDLTLTEGLLLGAIVASTDAAAVFSVLRSRNVHLPADVRSLIELESGSNDPMAVFLTISIVTLLTQSDASLSSLILSFPLQMGLGAALGYAFGVVMVALLNRVNLDHDGLYPVLSLTLVLLAYGLTDYAGGSGFLAVYVAGIFMGNRAYIHKRSLTRFHDGLAWLSQIAMFLTLGLLVFPSRIVPVIGMGVLIAAFLILVARPLSVYLSLLRSRFSLREQTLIGWVGLRGAVPIVLATFPLVAGVPAGEEIFNIVFFIVLASALVQGTTIPAVAHWLRVEGPKFQPEPISSGEPLERVLIEYLVPEDSAIVGRQIAQAGFPANAQVILIQRYDAYVVATGSTRLRRGDVLVLLADDESVKAIDRARDLVAQPTPLSICRQCGLGKPAPDAATPGSAAGVEPRT